ncbi:septum formation initiator [Micromonospora sp. NBC_01813]|uniref:septum formation initiator n=1 Tax=Micromonospora sp. NBC_01813 TaxID=2975988 RepID=UPI002DDC5BC4|nr:septum formation initiator [Micromonospora sp. NBC_01813]WSA09717.1 septum formation initiator [Micromonospora sp. NBC_01813]
MNRRVLLAVAGWCLAAVVATLIGLAALRVVGEGLTGGPAGEVLSQEEIARELAAAQAAASAAPTASGAAPTTSGVASSAPSVAPSASPSAGVPEPSPTTTAARQVAATPGGTVVAQCADGLASLVSWAPAQGYRATDVDRGPDDDAEVSFEGPAGEYEVTVGCVAGRPEITWELDD